MVESLFLTQEIVGSSTGIFLKQYYFCHWIQWIQWKRLGKTRISVTSQTSCNIQIVWKETCMSKCIVTNVISIQLIFNLCCDFLIFFSILNSFTNFLNYRSTRVPNLQHKYEFTTSVFTKLYLKMAVLQIIPDEFDKFNWMITEELICLL